jgi:hypothetical protein
LATVDITKLKKKKVKPNGRTIRYLFHSSSAVGVLFPSRLPPQYPVKVYGVLYSPAPQHPAVALPHALSHG